MSQADRSPERGTFSSAYLVTDYFAVENRTKGPVRWRIPRRSSRMAKLRRMLADAQRRFGMFVAEGEVVERAERLPSGPRPEPVARVTRRIGDVTDLWPLTATYRVVPTIDAAEIDRLAWLRENSR